MHLFKIFIKFVCQLQRVVNNFVRHVIQIETLIFSEKYVVIDARLYAGIRVDGAVIIKKKIAKLFQILKVRVIFLGNMHHF